MHSAAIFFDIGGTLVSGSSFNDGAKDCLAKLRNAGFALGLISNTGNFSRAELLTRLPSDFSFDDFDNELIVLSSEHPPLQKPDLPIFQFAIMKASIPPWHCFFVGENLEETVAAQQTGMHGVRIRDPATDFNALPELIRHAVS